MASEWPSRDWRDIVARCPEPHPFLTEWWQRAWWDTFGEGELTVLALRSGEEPAGIVVLHTTAEGLTRLLANREVTDYPAAVIARGHERTVAERLLEYARDAGWSRLELDNQRPESPFTDAVLRAAAEAGMASTVAPAEAVAILELPARPDEWRQRLDRHARHELARKQRRLARDRPRARRRTADTATLERDFDAFLRLHRRAAGAKASFMTPRNEEFVRRVVAAADREGGLRLDVLQADGEPPLAVALGFVSASTHYLYNMAFDRDAHALSPGIVLVASIIEGAIEEGRTRLDFLRGLERYKCELGALSQRLVRVEVAVL